MRLFEAIVDANHRALAGDKNAGLRMADYTDELPIVALTCIDPRLNPLFPQVMGVTNENFIWLRNAGNIILDPMSSTMRSLALACAVKGGKEIVIIGHTDCQVRKTSVINLTEAFRALGIQRSAMPDNLTEFFGLFASEQQNVIKAVEYTRNSPLIGPNIPVQGFMVDTFTGRLEWVVNGYEAVAKTASENARSNLLVSDLKDVFNSMPDFKMGEMKTPENKIGELATESQAWLNRAFQPPEAKPVHPVEAVKPPPIVIRPQPPLPSRIPVPPVVPPNFRLPPKRQS